VEGALGRGAVAEEDEADGVVLAVVRLEGGADADAELAADDAVPAEVVELLGEEVHRAALAAGATGDLAEQLRHPGARVAAQGQVEAVAAVGGYNGVLGELVLEGSDTHRLMADVGVEKAGHLLLLVGFDACFFKISDKQHLLQHDREFLTRDAGGFFLFYAWRGGQRRRLFEARFLRYLLDWLFYGQRILQEGERHFVGRECRNAKCQDRIFSGFRGKLAMFAVWKVIFDGNKNQG
jgi:hypothetical protein